MLEKLSHVLEFLMSLQCLIPSRFFIALIAVWISCTAAQAQEKYRIEGTHTFVHFDYSHWGLSTQSGRFDKTSGVIELDRKTKTGTAQIDISSASINTGTPKFDDLLRSSDYFNATDFPVIRFTSSKFNFDEAGTQLLSIEGELSIKEVRLPVTLELHHFHCRFVPLYLNTACGANGSAKIIRSDFGLGRYTSFVSDAVSLRFSVEALKE
jgi:polyisoprenoid-binding protein YceI